MLIGVAATPQVAVPALDWLFGSHHELARVITQPDRMVGRGLKIQQSPVALWANNHGVNLLQPESMLAIGDSLAGLDLLITIGYGRLLPESILEIPTHGCVNLHFSLLPKYRGAAPVQRAIENGETLSGVTVFKLDSGMDTGPIYYSQSIEIAPEWRSAELLSELSVLGVSAIANSIEMIETGQQPIPQVGEASRANKLTKEEARINWSTPGHLIANRIRAFYPQPCAWTVFRGQKLKISRASISQATIDLAAGQLQSVENSCLIGTIDGVIEIHDVIPEGKSEMKAIDWSRGARFSPVEICD